MPYKISKVYFNRKSLPRFLLLFSLIKQKNQKTTTKKEIHVIFGWLFISTNIHLKQLSNNDTSYVG